MNEDIKYLGDVQRLVLKPGDIVVVMAPGPISQPTHDRLKEYAERQFPGHRVLVLGDGLKIGVLGAEAE